MSIINAKNKTYIPIVYGASDDINDANVIIPEKSFISNIEFKCGNVSNALSELGKSGSLTVGYNTDNQYALTIADGKLASSCILNVETINENVNGTNESFILIHKLNPTTKTVEISKIQCTLNKLINDKTEGLFIIPNGVRNGSTNNVKVIVSTKAGVIDDVSVITSNIATRSELNLLQTQVNNLYSLVINYGDIINTPVNIVTYETSTYGAMYNNGRNNIYTEFYIKDNKVLTNEIYVNYAIITNNNISSGIATDKFTNDYFNYKWNSSVIPVVNIINLHLSELDNSVNKNEQSISILNTSVNKNENSISILNTSVNKHNTSIISLINDLSLHILDNNKKFTEIDTSISNISTRISNHLTADTTKKSEIDASISSIKTSISNINTSISNISTRVSNNNTSISNLSIYAANISTNLSAHITDNTNKFKDIDTSIKDISSRIYNVADDLDNYATDFQGLINTINGNISTHISNVSNKFDSIDNTLTTINSSIKNISTRLNSNIEDINAHINDLDKKITTINSSISDISTRLSNHISNTSIHGGGSSTDISDLSTRISNVSTTVSGHTTLINDLSTKLNNHISNNSIHGGGASGGTTIDTTLFMPINGSSTCPIVLFSGTMNKSSISGCSNKNITITQSTYNGGITLTVKSTGYKIHATSCVVTLKASTKTGSATLSLSGRSDGAHWFESNVLSDGNTEITIRIREFHQADGNNDSWESSSWENISANVLISGYLEVDTTVPETPVTGNFWLKIRDDNDEITNAALFTEAIPYYDNDLYNIVNQARKLDIAYDYTNPKGFKTSWNNNRLYINGISGYYATNEEVKTNTMVYVYVLKNDMTAELKGNCVVSSNTYDTATII